MMKSGKNLPICCCKNRPKVFKSTSFTTVWEVLQPPNLFSNACGIVESHVIEFNPISPLKGHLKWLMINPDHRKILIVDGKVAISGGINISNVYSAGFPEGKK